MKLQFRTVSGETFTHEYEPTTQVGVVKERVASERGLAKDTMKLVFKGKVLDKEQVSLTEAGLTEDGFVVVFAPKPKPQAAQPAPAAAAAQAPAQPSAQATPTPEAPRAAPSQPAAAAPQAPAGGTFSADSNLLAGSALEGAINSICEMGFERDQVARAMRAAFNNPERAVEYLTTGSPCQRLLPLKQQLAAVVVASPTLLLRCRVSRVLEEVQVAVVVVALLLHLLPLGPRHNRSTCLPPPAASQQGAAPGPLDFLRNRPELQLLRRAVQGNPNILVPMLQELGKSNPQMLQLINSHQAEFLQLLESEGDEGDEGLEEMLGAMGAAGGDMPGTTTIQLTPEEASAVERLEALGFDRSSCLEAFLACDKNEELAANYLAENMFD